MPEDSLKRKVRMLGQISDESIFYSSLVMLVMIIALFIYFISIKRWKRFEMTILFFMTLKYILHLHYHVYFEETNNDGAINLAFIIFSSALTPLFHW